MEEKGRREGACECMRGHQGLEFEMEEKEAESGLP